MIFKEKEVRITPNLIWAMIPDQFVWNLYYYKTMLPDRKLTLDRNGMPVPVALKERKVSWWA